MKWGLKKYAYELDEDRKGKRKRSSFLGHRFDPCTTHQKTQRLRSFPPGPVLHKTCFKVASFHFNPLTCEFEGAAVFGDGGYYNFGCSSWDLGLDFQRPRSPLSLPTRPNAKSLRRRCVLVWSKNLRHAVSLRLSSNPQHSSPACLSPLRSPLGHTKRKPSS